MNTKDRLKIFLDDKGMSPTAMEKKLGWGVGAFTKAKSITADRVAEVLGYFPELSAEWLLRGEGEMLKSEIPSKELDRINKLVDTITTLQDTINEKSEALAIALDRIRQLENKLK